MTCETTGEGSLFQAFVPDDKAVAIPIQDLDEIPSAIEEKEQRTGQQVARVRDFDQLTQPFEAFSHVDALVIEEDAVNAGRPQRLIRLQHGKDIGEKS